MAGLLAFSEVLNAHCRIAERLRDSAHKHFEKTTTLETIL